MGDARHQVTFALREEDFVALQKTVFPRRAVFLAGATVLLLIATAGLVPLRVSGFLQPWMLMLGPALTCGMLLLWSLPRRSIARAIRSDPKRFPTHTQTLRLTPSGIDIDGGRAQVSSIHWTGVERIDETANHIYLFLHRVRAVVIPKRAFPNEGAAASFCSEILRLHTEARDPSPAVVSRGYSEHRFEFSLTRADYVALTGFLTRRLNRPRRGTAALGVGLVLLGAVTLGIALHYVVALVLTATGALMLLIGTASWWAVQLSVLLLSRNMKKNPGAYSFEPQQVSVGPSGVRKDWPGGRAEVPWWRFSDLAETGSHYFLMFTDRSALILPKAAVPIHDLGDQVRSWQEECLEPRGGRAEVTDLANLNPFAPPEAR